MAENGREAASGAGVLESIARTRGVERVKLFGFDCLRVGGKVFAKVDKDRLVMKLPASRIAELDSAGLVAPYGRERGAMKAWVVADVSDARLAAAMAEEALGFVSGS